MKRTAVLLFAVCGLFAVAGADEPEKADPPKDKKHTNRLARESSPYLLQHAHNPVDWYPWGEEAFAKAKKEGKLVFLSVGYSSCHWCHVMERESFSNEEIAKYLNEHFVCIKVDREERPDIDNIYLTALQVQGIRGGWPMSMFLTADGKPIAGGTYWPPEDKEVDGEKVRGFKTILKIIHDFHKDKPKALQVQADGIAKRTAEELAGAARGAPLVDLDRDLVTGATDGLKEEFDKLHGGFGSPANRFRGTKFPMPPSLQLLQSEAARTKSKELDEMVQVTLDHMARGGIYDHLGGGFHRYSTERTWTVPHFEKMLYDNAQLLEVYARAYRETKKPQYKRVLEQTLAFIDRDLTSPDGVFYSALDADSDGEEGKFYVWTGKEIDDALGKEDAAFFKKVYGADDKPNFDGKYHILVLPAPLSEKAADLKTTEDKLEERLSPLRKKLLDVRAKRVRPFLDTKVLTAWNGQMIAGLAQAGQALDDKKSVQAAVKAADFVLKNLRNKDGRLSRTYGAAPGQKPEARLNGYLDDYAFLVHGLLCLHDATGEAKWLDEAKALTDVMVKFYGDKAGGFYYTSNDHEELFARAKDQYDGAQPSANSVAARNLTRLWVKTGDERYAKLAERTFKALATPLKNSPTSLPALADALALYLDARKKK
jgi:uncharacterized protein YyaL (SSP411 family)